MSPDRSDREEPATASVQTLPTPPSETTDLERRVLAHERVLQALIAYMARTEPHFVDHLIERFVEPMNMARREHDHREADDYAEEFIRAVIRIGEDEAPEAADAEAAGTVGPDQPARPPAAGDGPGASLGRRATRHRVQVAERNGIWEVSADGAFRGNYHQKEHALAAAALLKLSLR